MMIYSFRLHGTVSHKSLNDWNNTLYEIDSAKFLDDYRFITHQRRGILPDDDDNASELSDKKMEADLSQDAAGDLSRIVSTICQSCTLCQSCTIRKNCKL